MSTASPTRPSRRAATRRQAVIDSSDVEDASFSKEDVSEEFTPAPKKPTATTTKRTSIRRRTTANVSETPQPAAKPRRNRISESVEPSQVFSPPVSEAPTVPSSPAKQASPRKQTKGARQNVRTQVKTESTVNVAEVQRPAPLPTPQSSQSPETTVMEDTAMEDVDMTDAPTENISPQKVKSPQRPIKLERKTPTPLADITEIAVNEQPSILQSPAQVQKVNTAVTIMEKPMDIVIRKRAAGLPMVREEGAPKQRMVITYLILNNFKSYAGRQEVGPFHASFSSVVGPNGSGKSNVIDSLLFVFGFRASKMRQGKLSALIHNSAAFPDLDYCEVEVHFQEVVDLPAGGHEIIPDSQLIISRRAFKNNSSNYYINGRTSNFTTVTTLLKDKGVDLDHKRFLILQGEVESIAQMKPKAASEHDDGLLEYLEDIIGTSKYKAPIEESVTQTEELNEVCREKSGRVQHVEKEKNALEEKKDKALAYINDENELAMRQAALCQIYIAESSDTAEVAQEATTKLQRELDEELQRHAGSEAGIKQLEKQYKSGQKEYERVEEGAQSALKEIAKLDKEAVKYEEKRKFLTNKRKKLEKTIETSTFGANEASIQIKQSVDDIERNTAEIQQLEEEMHAEEQELAKIRESLKGKTQGLSDEIAARQKSLEPWNAKINEKESAIAVAQSELEILLEKDNAGAVAAAEIQAKIEGLEDKRNSKIRETAQLQAEVEELTHQLANFDNDLEGLAQQETKIRSKLSDARQKADEARSNLSATQSQGNVLSGLTRLKESGRINGFHGRLGNLGTIDQKYDVAISTACPALDNLVVDSVEVGQQCIEYLRKNNLGRANFICLDKLPQRDLGLIDVPEDVPRLFDLVKSKEDRFRPAFFSVMQNTLVARDLEQANRIAYGAQRWRVVTLEGQLIDKSGTMSGGGTRVAKGAMSSKLASTVTRDQVSKLEVDRDALEQSLQEIHGRQNTLEATRKDVGKRIPQLQTQLQKFGLEVSSIEKNIKDASKRLSELEKEQTSSKADKARKSTLEKTIGALETEVETLRSEMATVEAEIKSLQDKIMEIGGVKLRSQKAKVDGLKDQIEILGNEMSATEVNKAKAEKLKVKHEKSHKDATKEFEASGAELEKVEADLAQHNANTAGSRQAAEEAQETLEEYKENLAELKKELDEKAAELNETRAVEIEMRNNLEENQKTLNEALKRVRHWEEKLSKLSLHSIAALTGEGEAAAPQTTRESSQEPSELQEDEERTEPAGESIPLYTRDELHDMSKETLKSEIADLEKKTSTTSIDLTVLSEYRRRVQEHTLRAADLATAVSTRDTAKKRLDELRRLRLEGFMEGFSIISLKLKEMYQMITMGGNAELELVDSLDPFSEGILFSVMPPKKSWKNISNLSGGEKTLSSLALVFALHHYRPTPLYVMDEIDAALDFRNVSIVASYIKERTKNAQFIVISLRNNMFELASRLVGVYKVNHMTKSVTIENRDYLAVNA